MNQTHKFLTDEQRITLINKLTLEVSLRLAMPIMLAFWLLDVFYAPHLKWHFLAIRALIVPLCLFVTSTQRFTRQNLLAAEAVICIFIGSVAAQVTAMAILDHPVESPYFNGLSLVSLGSLPFFPFRRSTQIGLIGLIYGPYFAISGYFCSDGGRWPLYFVNVAFAVCTIIVTLGLRGFVDQLTENELRAERRLTTLALQVAHDIRSPIAALKIAAGHLRGSVPDSSMAALKLFSNALTRIEEIASDLLDKGSRKNTNSSTDLYQVVRELVAERLNMGRVSRQIEIFADSGAIPVEVPAAQIKRVISNLLNNAVDATQDGDRIDVRIGIEGAVVRLVVADCGSGMSDESLRSLRQGRNFTSKSGGYGLGFEQVRSAVRDWNGQLHIDSKIGSGTTVTIEIPCPPR